jgi:hypothetical protein
VKSVKNYDQNSGVLAGCDQTLLDLVVKLLAGLYVLGLFSVQQA